MYLHCQPVAEAFFHVNLFHYSLFVKLDSIPSRMFTSQSVQIMSFFFLRVVEIQATSQTASYASQNQTSIVRHCRKIVTVELDFFPEAALQEGLVIERLIRDYLGTVGLRQISGLRRSDLFILTDADELPTRDVIEFLRWHDGYTQPVTLSYR